MKVRMITTAAGPTGVYRAGETHDVPDVLGKLWLGAGFAAHPEASQSKQSGRKAAERAALAAAGISDADADSDK